jgi:hypothetical protein
MSWLENVPWQELKHPRLEKPCCKCGAVDRFPTGGCRPCAKKRAETYVAVKPPGRAENAQAVSGALRAMPTTRSGLEKALGISQQRVSEALRDLGAVVVGYAPRQFRGHPMPVYALPGCEQASIDLRTPAANSVWAIGARA